MDTNEIKPTGGSFSTWNQDEYHKRLREEDKEWRKAKAEGRLDEYEKPYRVDPPESLPGIPRILIFDPCFKNPNVSESELARHLTYRSPGNMTGVDRPISEMAKDPTVSDEYKKEFYKKHPCLLPRPVREDFANSHSECNGPPGV